MKTLREFITESRIHIDNRVNNFMISKGYMVIGSVETKKRFKASVSSEMYIAFPDAHDKAMIRSIPLKPGEEIYRYATRSSASGGIMGFVVVNADSGYVRFMKQTEFGDETIEFEGQKYKTQWIAIDHQRAEYAKKM